jgi:molybdate transport system ATP-binding protein
MIDVRLELSRGQFAVSAAFATPAPVGRALRAIGLGKTSIVQALAGLVAPRSGHVRVNDETLYDSAAGIDLPPERRRIGYVFQDALLFPHLTVRGNLEYGERLTPEAERYVDRAQVIDLLGLSALADRRVANLSGGERQRVAIGRALLASPRLLLMDEPLAGPGQREEERDPRLRRDPARRAAHPHRVREPLHRGGHAHRRSPRARLGRAHHRLGRAHGAVGARGPRALPRALPGRRGDRDAGRAPTTNTTALTTLAFDGGELLVPVVHSLPGEPVRIRIRARGRRDRPFAPRRHQLPQRARRPRHRRLGPRRPRRRRDPRRRQRHHRRATVAPLRRATRTATRRARLGARQGRRPRPPRRRLRLIGKFGVRHQKVPDPDFLQGSGSFQVTAPRAETS